jgi:hypothetical protein
VEEAGMVNVQIWADLAQIRFRGTRFVLCADFQQFGPVAEHWCGSSVAEGLLEDSDMLFEMCGGHRFTLTENRRSDQPLFDFYTTLGDDVQEDLARARQLFPKTDRKAAYTLTMSHARRVIINKQRNEQDKPDDAVLLKVPTTTGRGGNLPQNMWIWVDLVLIGAGGHTKKGLFYTISAIDESHVTFSCGLKLTREQTCKCCRLSYAITFASAQGLTLRGVVRLDCESKHFTRRHLYVGISRATAAELVEVC